MLLTVNFFVCSERKLPLSKNLKVKIGLCITFGGFVLDNNLIQCQSKVIFVSIKEAGSGEATSPIIFGRAGYTKK